MAAVNFLLESTNSTQSAFLPTTPLQSSIQIWTHSTSSLLVLLWRTNKHFHILFLIMKVACLVGFLGGSVVEKPPAQAGDVGLIPGVTMTPRRRKWQPTPVFSLGKSHGQRSLVGCSPWGHKDLDVTLWLNHHHHHRSGSLYQTKYPL